MLSVYWFCFVVAGVFVLLAVVGGLDGAEFDAHFDTDFDIRVDADIELTDPGDRPRPSVFQPTPPRRNITQFVIAVLKSLKFWTFGLCFFGLTGLVLSQLPIPPLVVAIAATGMGILCGALVSGILQALRRRQVDSLVRSSDLTGLTGTVELPFNDSSRGKIRLLVKGTMMNVVAYTDEPKEFQVGDSVMVVGMEQNRLWVVSTDSLNKTPNAMTEPQPESDRDRHS